MKRKICLSLLGLGIALVLRAQDAETALAKVHYIFKHVNDTTVRDKFLQDEVITYIGKSGSYYTSYSSNRMQEEVKRQMDAPDFDGKLVFKTKTTAIAESYLFNSAKRTLREISKVGRDFYYVEDAFPTLDWTILDDTKTIGGYSCQKAQTTYKGRTYEAWFTTELPFSYGPWKLQGLPGLILSATDLTHDVSFEYAGFDKVDSENQFVATPAGASKTTGAEILKLKEAFKANPTAFLQTRSSGSGAQVISASADGGTVNFSGATAGGGAVTARGSFSAGGGGSAASMDMSKIKSFNIAQDDNYKPSRNTNNPIELTP